MSEPAHPREVFDYERGETVERAFLDALERGRLHHAWLLTGPEGVGKATFAYRAARRLLGAGRDASRGLLGTDPEDREARLVTARAHPDLMVLERAVEDGKTKKYIAVDDARTLPEFFSKAPSRSGFRVAIVDAADDMNLNAANALLKTLEEPPERGVLFLVAHAPGRLMATIRSRCRRLVFQPWPDEAVEGFLRGRTELADGEIAALARMAKGAPGRALALAGSQALEFDALARELVAGRRPRPLDLVKLADGFRGAEGQARFELLFERLAEAVRERATAGTEAVERWANLWDKISAAPAQADAVNLDRADVLFTHLAELEALEPGMLIDSHVNLHAHQFDEDREAVIERARAAGIELMVEISDRLSSVEKTIALAEAHPDIWCTVGTHPHEAKENPELTAHDLLAHAERKKVVGIGECGLDFHYDLSPREVQAKVFRAHVAAARESGLPLVTHTREADETMAEILAEEYARGPFKLLMHCYTSGPELAKKAAELGGWFSVSGIATFKAAEEVRAVIRDMPAERIIVETDCPYLAPVPHRGRRNEPAYLPHVLEKLAGIRGWTLDEAEQRTEDAFFALFDRIPRS